MNMDETRLNRFSRHTLVCYDYAPAGAFPKLEAVDDNWL